MTFGENDRKIVTIVVLPQTDWIFHRAHFDMFQHSKRLCWFNDGKNVICDVLSEVSCQESDLVYNATDLSLVEEEHFNVTEHRGFFHGFVEALSVILVCISDF